MVDGMPCTSSGGVLVVCVVYTGFGDCLAGVQTKIMVLVAAFMYLEALCEAVSCKTAVLLFGHTSYYVGHNTIDTIPRY